MDDLSVLDFKRWSRIHICSLSLSLWRIFTRWMEFGGSGTDTLAGKAHSFGTGCGLSGTVTIVC